MKELAGGCQVSELRGGPSRDEGALRCWPCFGVDAGAEAISLRALELPAGAQAEWSPPLCDEVLFLIEGSGEAWLDGRRILLQPEDGVFLPPGVRFALRNDGPGPLLLASSRCPDPEGAAAPASDALAASSGAGRSGAPRAVHARLSEQEVETTADRWYAVLLGKHQGSARVTQFVGSIPPGRAPEHYHHYEEVIVILHGNGRMWAGATHAEVGSGSCIYLPRRQPHSLENTGGEALVLLGVFYPAGSPAVAYET